MKRFVPCFYHEFWEIELLPSMFARPALLSWQNPMIQSTHPSCRSSSLVPSTHIRETHTCNSNIGYPLLASKGTHMLHGLPHIRHINKSKSSLKFKIINF